MGDTAALVGGLEIAASLRRLPGIRAMVDEQDISSADFITL